MNEHSQGPDPESPAMKLISLTGGPFDGATLDREPGEDEVAIPLSTGALLESAEKVEKEMDVPPEGHDENKWLNKYVRRVVKGMNAYVQPTSDAYAALYRLEGEDRLVFKGYMSYNAWFGWQTQKAEEYRKKQKPDGTTEEPRAGSA